MPRFTIHDLAATIDARAASGGEASYTRKLLDKGAEHCAKKFGEEAVETVIAAIENNREPSDRRKRRRAVSFAGAVEVARRHGSRMSKRRWRNAPAMSGLEEKAARKRD